MRFLTCLSVLLMAISLESCAPNSSVALDNGNSDVSTPGESPAALREPAIKITVAELMDRVVHASSDSFLFPCTLNAYSAADRAKLQKRRQTWLSKERETAIYFLRLPIVYAPAFARWQSRTPRIRGPIITGSSSLVRDHLKAICGSLGISILKMPRSPGQAPLRRSFFVDPTRRLQKRVR